MNLLKLSLLLSVAFAGSALAMKRELEEDMQPNKRRQYLQQNDVEMTTSSFNTFEEKMAFFIQVLREESARGYIGLPQSFYDGLSIEQISVVKEISNLMFTPSRPMTLEQLTQAVAGNQFCQGLEITILIKLRKLANLGIPGFTSCELHSLPQYQSTT